MVPESATMSSETSTGAEPTAVPRSDSDPLPLQEGASPVKETRMQASLGFMMPLGPDLLHAGEGADAVAASEVLAIEALVRDGHLDEAGERLRELDTREVHDRAIHARLADLCEELGMGDRLVVELNYAFRDAPDELEILKRLGHVHADAGRFDRAARCWHVVTERAPHDVDAWEELGSVLCELCRLEEAREVYLRAHNATKDPRFQARLRALQASPILSDMREGIRGGGGREGSVEEEGEEPLPTHLSEAVLVRFVSLFSGREGVYARQWAKPPQSGYNPVREPFTVHVARNHMLGNHTVGIYPLRLDNTVNFAAIDLDLSRALLERTGPGRPEWEAAMGRLAWYSQALRMVAMENGLPMVLEDSGSKGRHCWIFFAEPLLARWARRLGSELVRMAGNPPADVGVEVFPKQTTLEPTGLGNLIKLPLGLHRMNGRRAVFLDDDGVAVANQEAFLLKIPRASRDSVVQFVERVAPRTEASSQPGSLPWDTTGVTETTCDVQPRDEDARRRRGRSRPDGGGDAEAASGDPRSWERAQAGPAGLPVELLEYSLEGDAEVQLVLGRCAVLRELVEMSERDNALSNDEAIVLIHSLGHLNTGPRAVNTVLRRCMSIDPSMYLKSRLRGSPVSCPKIRMRVPHVTSRVPCNCEFAREAGMYPTPVLHLTAPSSGGAGDLGQLQFQALLQDFLRLRKSLYDTQRQFEVYTARMADWFERAGIEQFQTAYGMLERVKGEDGKVSFTLRA